MTPMKQLRLLEAYTLFFWPTSWPQHLWSLRYFWWTGGLETGHGEHEIGFYHNHGLHSFVVATAENPHPASCAVLLLDRAHEFFWGSGNSTEEVQQSCGTMKAHIHMQNHKQAARLHISTQQSRVWPRGVHTEMWSRLKQTIRRTVRTGSVSSGFISAGRFLAGVYTRLKLYTPSPLLCVCAWSVYSMHVRHACVPALLNVKSD